jgi:ABC-type transport system involved in cytochrome bd biosynthesis fused ATPase/permease subunit
MKTLFLEQRLQLARHALNKHSLKFQDELPTKELRKEFNEYILNVMSLIEGDVTGNAQLYFEKLDGAF